MYIWEKSDSSCEVFTFCVCSPWENTRPLGTNPKTSIACSLWEQAHLPLKVPLTAYGNTYSLRHCCFLTQASSPASHQQTFLDSPLLCPPLLLFCLRSSQASRTDWICTSEMLFLLHSGMHLQPHVCRDSHFIINTRVSNQAFGLCKRQGTCLSYTETYSLK